MSQLLLKTYFCVSIIFLQVIRKFMVYDYYVCTPSNNRCYMYVLKMQQYTIIDF